jgi:hypothetical protein
MYQAQTATVAAPWYTRPPTGQRILQPLAGAIPGRLNLSRGRRSDRHDHVREHEPRRRCSREPARDALCKAAPRPASWSRQPGRVVATARFLQLSDLWRRRAWAFSTLDLRFWTVRQWPIVRKRGKKSRGERQWAPSWKITRRPISLVGHLSCQLRDVRIMCDFSIIDRSLEQWYIWRVC